MNNFNNYGYRKPSSNKSSIALGIVVALVVIVVVLTLFQMFLGIDIVQGMQDLFDAFIDALTGAALVKAPML